MKLFLRLFSLTLVLTVVAAPALAELPSAGTIGLYFDDEDGNDLSRAGVVKHGKPFELVVRIDTDIETGSAVFQMTELNLLYPGVFKVSTWRYNDSTFELERNDIGAYAFAYAACAPAGEVEILRVGYVHSTGHFPTDVPLYIDGVKDFDHLRGIDGDPGVVGCDSEGRSLDPEPWTDTSFDPMVIPGVDSTDGLLVLNPSSMVPVGTGSFSALKAQF